MGNSTSISTGLGPGPALCAGAGATKRTAASEKFHLSEGEKIFVIVISKSLSLIHLHFK
jgi:hypothetical protein